MKYPKCWYTSQVIEIDGEIDWRNYAVVVPADITACNFRLWYRYVREWLKPDRGVADRPAYDCDGSLIGTYFTGFGRVGETPVIFVTSYYNY